MFNLTRRPRQRPRQQQGSADRADILWLTNIPTPYTEPVWRELTTMCRFQVACLAGNERNRDWSIDTTGLDLTVLDAPPIRLGYERTVYGPSVRLARLMVRRPRVVIVDGWESLAALQTLMTAKVLRIPLLLSYWSTETTHRYREGPVAAYRRWFFRQAATVLTPGAAATAAVIKQDVPAERVVTGIASVDVARFAEALTRRS